MTYTFKLSRRLALIKATILVVAVQFAISCNAGDSLSAPSDGSNPISLVIMPDSTIVEVSGTMRFSAHTGPTQSDYSTLSTGKRWGVHKKVVSLEITPGFSRVALGGSRTFNAMATLSDGSTIEPALVWSATGGNIDASGKYMAGERLGDYTVAGKAWNGMTDTAAVAITAVTAVAQLVVSPASVALPAGDRQQFAVEFMAADGATVDATATFSATGGSISPTGLYTAGGTTGTFKVIATDSATDLADTAEVTISTVEGPSLRSIVVEPASISLSAGSTQQFTALGKLSDGSTSSVNVSWTASGGVISPAGVYTAGQTGGAFRVIATQSGGTLADTAVVTVTSSVSPAPPPGSGKTFFVADAESGVLSPPWPSWGLSHDPEDPSPSISTTRTRTGARSYKLQVTTADAKHNSKFLANAPQVSMGSTKGGFQTGYYNFWAFIESGYDGAAESGAWNLLAGWMTNSSDGHPHPIGHVGLEKRSGVLQLMFRLSNAFLGNCFTAPTISGYTNLGANGYYFQTGSSPNGITPFPRGQWVHVSVYFKMAPTNGQVTVWQNGVKVMDLTHANFNTYIGHGGNPGTVYPCQSPNGDMLFQIGNYGGPGSTLPEVLYLDDIKVTDYRVIP